MKLVFSSPYLAEMCEYITEAKFSDYLPMLYFDCTSEEIKS